MGWPRPARAWVLSAVLMRSPKPEMSSCGRQGPGERVCAVHGADAGAGPGRRGRARGSSPPDLLLPGLLQAMPGLSLTAAAAAGTGAAGEGGASASAGGEGEAEAPRLRHPPERSPARGHPLRSRPAPSRPRPAPRLSLPALPLQKSLELWASYHRLLGLPEAEKRGWTLPQGTPVCRNGRPDRRPQTPTTSDSNPSPTLPLAASSFFFLSLSSLRPPPLFLA